MTHYGTLRVFFSPMLAGKTGSLNIPSVTPCSIMYMLTYILHTRVNARWGGGAPNDMI